MLLILGFGGSTAVLKAYFWLFTKRSLLSRFQVFTLEDGLKEVKQESFPLYYLSGPITALNSWLNKENITCKVIICSTNALSQKIPTGFLGDYLYLLNTCLWYA